MSSKIEKLSRDSTIQLTAGAFSGVFSDILTHPFDLLTTRAQATIGKHEKLIPQIKNIVQHEGYRSLWKGFSSVFVASVPGHAAYFFGYELSKTILNDFIKIENDDSMLVHFVSGLSADVFSSFIYTPSDIVKQHLQSQKEGKGKAKFSGSLDVIRKIYKQHGLKNGLFKGLTVNMMSDAPTSAFYFVGYEQLKILAKNILGTKSVDDLPSWAYLASGGVAAGVLTAAFTPIDVIRIRLQVTNQHFDKADEPYKGFVQGAKKIFREEGLRAFWKGVTPSVLCVTLGTSITMVAYEECKKFLKKVFD